MKASDLEKIEQFCRPYYYGTGRWHAWDHAQAIKKLSLDIAVKEVKEADRLIVQAAGVIHDIGRIIKDEGHAEESGRIVEPFLRSMELSELDVEKIIDAVVHHDVNEIDKSKYIEARVVFDADKIEILSVYGFWRVAYWLVEERRMELGEAIRFLDEYCAKFRSKLHSSHAKAIADKEYPLVQRMIKLFNAHEQKWRAR